jgi:hypothetical protein
MIITLFLALVASVVGVNIRGASVTYDTYIMGNSNTNYNTLTTGGWDGPFSISAAGAISGVTSATQSLLIKFDLSSLVGATLVPNSPVWFNYLVYDGGDPASLRELTVPWNHVCTSPAKAHAPLTTAGGTLAENPFRWRVPLCPSLRSAGHSHVDQPPIRSFIVELHQHRRRRSRSRKHWLAED